MQISPQDQQEIFEKVSKLLNLADPSNNQNEHERMVAAKRAAEILEKYNLDFSEYEQGKADDSVTEETFEGQGLHYVWKRVLRKKMCDIFNCHSFYSEQKSKKAWKYTFIGQKNDIALLKHFYDRLVRDIELGCLSKHKIDGTTRKLRTKREKEEYGLGYVIVIGDRLKAMYEQFEQHATQQTTALVHIKRTAVDRFVRKNHPGLKGGRTVHANQSSAFSIGAAHGRNYVLNQPLNGSNGSTVNKPLLAIGGGGNP